MNGELFAYADDLFLRAKIKNLDEFMKRVEELKLLSVEFDYESLEASKGSNIGPIINMAILALLGYWIYLSYSFYKKSIKSGKGMSFGEDMFGFGKMAKVKVEG